MLPLENQDSSAPIFALPPPLSATPGASDNDFECEQAGVHPEKASRHRTQNCQTDSSPQSTRSSSAATAQARSIPSDSTSFAAPVTKHSPDKRDPDHEAKAEANTGRGQSRHWCGGDVDRAYSLIRASAQGDFVESQWCPLHLHRVNTSSCACDPDWRRTACYPNFEKRLRSDYDPERERLVLRLTESVLHEWVANSIFNSIRDQVQSHVAQADPDFATLASDIGLVAGRTGLNLGRVTVTDRTGAVRKVPNRRCPDGQLRFKRTPPGWPNPPYRFPGHRLPQFVIEVGFSQKAKDLQTVAWDYYHRSNGAMKTVLTISLEDVYRARRDGKKSQATFCLYRGPDRIYRDVLFRSADGQSVNGSLCLLISDLVPDQVIRDLRPQVRARTEDTTITIPFDQLCMWLAEAELEQEVDDRYTTAPEPPVANLKRPNWECDSESDHGTARGSSNSSGEEHGSFSSRDTRLRTRRETSKVISLPGLR